MKNKEETQPKVEEKDQLEVLKELGFFNSQSDFKSDYQYISIIGCIEGHTVMSPENKTTKYEHLIPELIAVEENPSIKGLFLILNTIGGDVEAGLALAELIASMSKPTVSLVIGGGHSIGIPLATSTDYSFIAKSATMTLHPVRTSGTLITAEPTFEYMRRTQERVVDFIAEHSRAEKADIISFMNRTDNMSNDVGTILIGDDAVKLGIIDQVGGISHALNQLKKMTAENVER